MTVAGKVWLVGAGPSDGGLLTLKGKAVLDQAEVVVYDALVGPEILAWIPPQAEKINVGKRAGHHRKTQEEINRILLEKALEGRRVVRLKGGDPFLFGRGGEELELLTDHGVAYEVVPGVTSALSGAALLGAPIGHDFCVISLSDLLTPWEVIENRLRCAAMGDFSICLYNPASHKRKDYLQKACDILLAAGKEPETVCGYVRSIGREGEEGNIVSLTELRDTALDMFTTVFIGSSTTLRVSGRMVTPRGYERKQGPCV